MSEDSTLTYDRWSVNANDLIAKSVRYLLQNGFSQSMTDAAAFTKEQKAGKSADEIKKMADEARAKRFEAILAGTVGIRVGGPRLPAIDRVMREIAEEMLRAIAADRKVAMPKGEVLKAALEKIVLKNEATIRERAQARLDESKTLAADLGDIFDAPEAAQRAAE